VITTGHVTAGTSAATLCVLPPGPCTVVITNTGTVTATVGAGTVSTLTTSTGTPVPAGGVLPFPLYPGEAPVPLQVITGTGTAVVGFLVTASSAVG
jgi:hypothetical protein